MGNWGEFVCEEVAGTTDASGLTTIEVSNPYCYLTQSQYTFVNSTLVVKFNETKAYAHFNGTVAFNSFQKYPFQYTFGTDDFGSTGGGGTVETTEGPLVEAGLTPNGARIEAKPFTINWDTHKVVAKLDMTTCQGVNENALSFSNNAANLAEWNTSNGASLHFYYTKDAYVWNGTANVQLTNTFTIQFRNSDDLSITPTKYVQVMILLTFALSFVRMAFILTAHWHSRQATTLSFSLTTTSYSDLHRAKTAATLHISM